MFAEKQEPLAGSPVARGFLPAASDVMSVA